MMIYASLGGNNDSELTMRRHDIDGHTISAAFHMKWHFPRSIHLWHSKSLHFHAPFGEVTTIQELKDKALSAQ